MIPCIKGQIIIEPHNRGSAGCRDRARSARSEMACAGGHASGGRRQGSEILSHSGDDRTPRTCHCPCGARIAGKRRHAGADKSRHSPRLGQAEICDRGRARHPTLLCHGYYEKAVSDSRCSQFRRAGHENLARPKTRRRAPKFSARRIDCGPNFLFRACPMDVSIPPTHDPHRLTRPCFDAPPDLLGASLTDVT